MKRKYSLFSMIVGLMVLIVSCDSIVDEKFLENATTVDKVELVATQNSAKGNTIELSMNTPGVSGYWDYNLGKALTNKVEFVYPIPGKSTFKYIGTLGAEFFEKTIDVQVDVLDTKLDQDWYDLVSDETAAGKTWVFDGVGGDNGLWWFMSPPGDVGGYMSVWWNAGGECCPPSDVSGRMKFDLDGAANFTYYKSPDAAPVKGSFVLDVANKTLKINNANVLGAEEGGANPSAFYQIAELSKDRLVLYKPDAVWDSGWTWIFVPAK